MRHRNVYLNREDHFPDLPALSTYHERLAQFTPTIAQGFIAYIGKKIATTDKKTLSS